MDRGVQTKQGSRPSCGDQEGRRGSEEVVPENLGVPLQGDQDARELCGGASRVPSTVLGMSQKLSWINKMDKILNQK